MVESARFPAVTPPEIQDLVPTGGSFSGLMSFDGEIRVDGTLEGRVRARGSLRLGPASEVRADIEVDELIVEGSLEGDVRARTRIVIGPTARVRGQLETPRLVVADGCQIEARCITTGSAPPDPGSAGGRPPEGR
jgi:cytoskeletal protein CcmA (bactofilin family)